MEVRRDYWDHDVKLVLSRVATLTESPLRQGAAARLYPIPMPEVPSPMSEEQIQVALGNSMRAWQLVISPMQDDNSHQRAELTRQFKFASFRQAVAFMSFAAPACDTMNHHPRWENIWKTVTVSLTTWDIGHRISDRDIVLGRYLDSAYRDFLQVPARLDAP